MFGRKELELSRQKKLALVLESGANRLALETELQNLRSAAGRTVGIFRARQKLALPIAAIAALAGFFVVGRRPGALLKRAMWLAKWAVPAYRLWKSFSGRTRLFSPQQPR